MNLLILRHGIAENPRDDQSDADRALTDEGRDRTRESVRGVLRMIDGVDVILTSPKIRARQTAELLSEVTGKQPQILVPLAEGSVKDVTTALALRPEPFIAVVGHEPLLGLLAEHLLAGEDANSFLILKKAGAMLLEIVDYADPGSANLIWSLPPKALRLLSIAAP